MHANIGECPGKTAPSGKSFEWLIPAPYLLLRAATAGGAVATGLIQTFVFARSHAGAVFGLYRRCSHRLHAVARRPRARQYRLRQSARFLSRGNQERTGGPASHGRHFILRAAGGRRGIHLLSRNAGAAVFDATRCGRVGAFPALYRT